MARAPRLDAPGSVHHVIMRGVDGRNVFVDDADRLLLLRLVGQGIERGEAVALAWALMNNHIHLVVRTGRTHVSHVMHWINGLYARHFNDRHERRGYLFQERFRSRLARSDADVAGLIRYVHRNPLDAGLVKSLLELERYPWCGYGAMQGAAPAEVFHDITLALSFFGESGDFARENHASWMQRPAPSRRLDELAEEVARTHGMEIVELKKRTRDSAPARRDFIESATARGAKPADVARWLGVSKPAISQALRRSRS